MTNDFPPKIGGIQSYLWELWRRLDPDSFEVMTTTHPAAPEFDAAQPFRIHRLPATQLLPTPGVARAVVHRAKESGVDLVMIDPAVPLGLLGTRLGVPYGVVLHGAEVTVPGRLPATRQLLAHVLRHAVHVVAAGSYPAAEGGRVAGPGRMPPVTVVPPGVDGERFHPLSAAERVEARRHFGAAEDALVVLSLSRLVPRKGMDVLIRAAARLHPQHPNLQVLIGGTGRDRPRLERLATDTQAPVRLLGEVSNEELPQLYGCSDVFAMLCRNRWANLEQEGFGIVFLEAAACCVPQVAGDSGGAAEAVVDGLTGLVVRRPADVEQVSEALERLLGEPDLRARMGEEARRRAVGELSYDVLAERLASALHGVGG